MRVQFERGANGAIVQQKPAVKASSAQREILRANQWKPGQSGNPAGRPKGVRNRLAEAFLDGLLKAYERGGQHAIDEVMKRQPAKFLAILAQILPKQIELDGDLNIKVTSAVDSLVTRLSSLSKRESEYDQERERAIKTIEYVPVEQLGAKLADGASESVRATA